MLPKVMKVGIFCNIGVSQMMTSLLFRINVIMTLNHVSYIVSEKSNLSEKIN